MPSFKTFGFDVNASNYFYPASTVKLPACILALEKLNNLNIKGLAKENTMRTLVGFEKQTSVTSDSSSQNMQPSIAHYIKKILLVSDNDAFNRLYEFLGQKYFNEKLNEKGLKNTKIVHRLQTSMNAEQNKYTNPIDFFDKTGLIYHQKEQYNSENLFPEEAIFKGKGYLDSKGELVNSPFEFTQKNKFALADQHQVLKALIFPNSVSKKQRFNLQASDYEFVYKYMSLLPTESDFPKYSSPDYWPTYCKFALFGSEKNVNRPQNIRIFNKVGDAYGFLLDNAYVVDFEAGVEFLLSVVIYCNEDQIFNDDKYEYDAVGLPFMKNLGQLLYDFEKSRPKKHKPDLSKMKFTYSLK